MDIDGNGIQRLTDTEGFNGNGIVSPDGNKIVFLSKRDGGKWELYVMDSDGRNQIRLTNNSVDDISPAWAPDSRKIAFMQEINGQWQSCAVNTDGSEFHQLTNGNFSNAEPQWSPNGKSIAFISERDGNENIYLMNSNGSKQQITATELPERNMSWSSDGKSLIFTLGEETVADLVSLNIKTGKTKKLTATNSRETIPNLSPDNKFVCFVSEITGSLEISYLSLKELR